MIQQKLIELEQCLKDVNNPILSYLDSDTPFNQAHFEAALSRYGLTPGEALNEWYQWKPGLSRDIIYTTGFKYGIFPKGSHIAYTEALEIYRSLLRFNKISAHKNLFPFMLAPGDTYDHILMVDLSESSETYGQLFYYYISLSGELNVISIYDSIPAMLEGIITCYRQQIYIYSEQSEQLVVIYYREQELSARINPKSSFWEDLEREERGLYGPPHGFIPEISEPPAIIPLTYYRLLCEIGKEYLCIGKEVERLGWLANVSEEVPIHNRVLFHVDIGTEVLPDTDSLVIPLFVDENNYPTLYRLHKEAFDRKLPTQLTLDEDPFNARDRRVDAISEVPYILFREIGEYPYAIACEGGKGAYTLHIPVDEYREFHTYFARIRNIFRMKTGDLLEVILIPGQTSNVNR